MIDMDIDQRVLTNTSPNYNVPWVILTQSKLRKIDCSNRTFSAVLRGFTIRHTEDSVKFLHLLKSIKLQLQDHMKSYAISKRTF